jgi:hypothetical protein
MDIFHLLTLVFFWLAMIGVIAVVILATIAVTSPIISALKPKKSQSFIEDEIEASKQRVIKARELGKELDKLLEDAKKESDKFSSNDMKEQDLEIYDVWKSPNGNLFIKISNNYSISIGPKGSHEPNDVDLKMSQYVKSSPIVPVKKVGKINFK